MELDKLTIGEVKELLQMFGGMKPADNHPWQIGKAYHIRTVTHYWTGRIADVTPQELVLEDAAWIADTGRFADLFKKGPAEVEPVEGPVIINRAAVIDAQVWNIDLPRDQK